MRNPLKGGEERTFIINHFDKSALFNSKLNMLHNKLVVLESALFCLGVCSAKIRCNDHDVEDIYAFVAVKVEAVAISPFRVF